MTEPETPIAEDLTLAPSPLNPAVQKSPLAGYLVGGFLAAAMGFGLSMYILPQGWQPVAPPDTALQDRIAVLEGRLAKPAAPDPRIDRLTNEIESLRAELSARTEPAPVDLSGVESRLTALEALPLGQGGISPAALATLQAEVAALKTSGGDGSQAIARVEDAAKAAEARLAQAQAEAKTLKAETEAAAKQAQVTALLTRLQTALDAGTGFALLAQELANAGITLPDPLAQHAETGLPSLRALQDSFPDAARAALEAARLANPGESWTARLGTFLQTQTAARSTEPRQGADPDAILSRVEAALTKGDLPAALAELTALPPEALTAVSDWQAKAQSRLDALTALQGITP